MKNIRRVLVANRGEIAVRIVRACRELGIEAVQACSAADEQSLPAKIADRAICIGPARAAESYLNPQAIINAALMSGADSIHPGYGFLSENATFAALCEQHGLRFIGPKPEVIRLMGDKAQARNLARSLGVPVAPGSDGPVSDDSQIKGIAKQIGFPLLIKASAGGGGRGMRVVESEAQLNDAIESARAEARAAFGDPTVYIERYMRNIRHVEIQVLGDGQQMIHLGERDCTIQRRHQKLLEESPSPSISPEMRGKMCEAALKLARHVGYQSAGTLEFILDSVSGEFYFIEMNTRIQVEHCVTELVTGIDLVKEQIRIADGEPLRYRQQDINFSGHAIECRINAENPKKNFMPSPGTLKHLRFPAGPGVRVDSHVFSGYAIPPFYDSLIAKFVVWGENRDEAIARMKRALAEFELDGVTSTASFHQSLLAHPKFIAGDVSTRFIQDEMNIN